MARSEPGVPRMKLCGMTSVLVKTSSTSCPAPTVSAGRSHFNWSGHAAARRTTSGRGARPGAAGAAAARRRRWWPTRRARPARPAVVERAGVGLAFDAVLPGAGQRLLRPAALDDQRLGRAEEAAVAAQVLDADGDGVGARRGGAVGHVEHLRAASGGGSIGGAGPLVPFTHTSPMLPVRPKRASSAPPVGPVERAA